MFRLLHLPAYPHRPQLPRFLSPPFRAECMFVETALPAVRGCKLLAPPTSPTPPPALPPPALATPRRPPLCPRSSSSHIPLSSWERRVNARSAEARTLGVRSLSHCAQISVPLFPAYARGNRLTSMLSH